MYSKFQGAQVKESSSTSARKSQFESLEKEDDFVELNNFLSDKSFISGYTISRDDIVIALHLEKYTSPARLEEVLKHQKFRYFHLILFLSYNGEIINSSKSYINLYIY